MSVRLFSNKSECCGCEACVNACPQSIIEMEADNEGFMYPHVAHAELCINCGRCEKVCPIKNVADVEGFKERAIAGYSHDQIEIKNSASGSLGTAIAKGFINQGGVVYGVSYTGNCKGAEYRKASTLAELEDFRTSKYIQSKKADTFQRVQGDLKAGIKVLFIGLPCVAYALQLYLGRTYENLFVCALICHGPTSPLVHRQYVEKLIDKYKSGVTEFSVRYKKDGWKPYYIRAAFENGQEHLEKFAESTYGVAFLYLKRPSCNTCPIKRTKIHADITIGDYHLASGGQFKPYNSDGVSSAFIHTVKGEYLASIADNFFVEEIPVKNALYSEAYHRAIPARRNREEFGRTLSSQGLDAACALRSVKAVENELARKAWVKRQGAKVKKLLLGRK